MNFSVDIVSVPVADQDRSQAFYTGVLGFALREAEALGDGRRWVELVPPAGGASITLVTWFGDSMPPGCLRGLVLGTDDAHAAFAELRSRGVEFLEDEVQDAPWGQWASFEDPDGNGWILVGPALE